MINLWVANHHMWVSLVFLDLGLAIAKRPRHGKPAWNHSYRALSNWATRSSKHDVIVLVYLATCLYYSFTFCFLRWFMVFGEWSELLAVVARHDSSGITCVRYPDVVINNKHNNSTRAWFVSHLHLVLSHEGLFGLHKTGEECFFRVHWESWLVCDDVVEVVSQEFSAAVPSMSIKHGEKRSLLYARTKWLIRLWPWLLQIQNNRDPIFIVISWSSVMSVSSIALNEALMFGWDLGLLNFGDHLSHWSNSMITNSGWGDSKNRRSFKLLELETI